MNNYIIYMKTMMKYDENLFKTFTKEWKMMKTVMNCDEKVFSIIARMYMYWTKLSHDEIKTRKNKKNMEK